MHKASTTTLGSRNNHGVQPSIEPVTFLPRQQSILCNGQGAKMITLSELQLEGTEDLFGVI